MLCSALLRRHESTHAACNGLKCHPVRRLATKAGNANLKIRYVTKVVTQEDTKDDDWALEPKTRRTSAKLHKLNASLEPESLTRTLMHHRKANMASRITEVPTTNPDVFRPKMPLSPRKVVQDKSDHPKLEQRPAFTLTDSFFTKEFIEGVKREASRIMARDGITQGAAEGSHKERKATKEYEDRCVEIRRQFLEEFEQPAEGEEFSAPIPSETAWKTQMDVLRRVRPVFLKARKHRSFDPRTWKEMKDGILEYTGKPVPFERDVPPQTPSEPWASSSVTLSKVGLDRLDAEIEDFMEWLVPTEVEKAARIAVIDTIFDIVDKYAPGLSAEPFGSQRSGLAMSTSDADIRLFHPEFNYSVVKGEQAYRDKREEILAGLRMVFSKLESHPDFSDSVLLEATRFKKIITKHKPTGLNIQIVAGPPTYHSQRLTRENIEKHPHLKTVFFLLKSALDMRGLSEVYTGGLGSYTVFNMIIAALNSRLSDQEHASLVSFFNVQEGLDSTDATAEGPPASSSEAPLTLPSEQPTHLTTTTSQPTPATLLLHVLHFYSQVYNPYAHALSASPFRIHRKILKSPNVFRTNSALDTLCALKPHQHYLLALQDPADPTNDLGAKSYAFKHVQATFGHIYSKLLERMEKGDRSVCMLRSVVGRCDYVYDDRRALLELFGEGCKGPVHPVEGVRVPVDVENEGDFVEWAAKSKGQNEYYKNPFA